MAEQPRFLIILSDLHLSEGWDPDTGLLSRREDFFFDTTLERFLSKQAQFAERTGCRFRLIFAGDLVDFQQLMSTPGGKNGSYRASHRWGHCFSFGKDEKRRHRCLGLSTSPDHTVWKLFRAFVRGTPSSRALEKKAYSIQKLLNVPYLVFGHTHEAHRKLFSRGERRAEYFNSGTWTKVFTKSMEERLLKEESEFVYVQLDRDERKIEFLRWRDDLNGGEPVLLFEEPGKKGAKKPC